MRALFVWADGYLEYGQVSHPAPPTWYRAVSRSARTWQDAHLDISQPFSNVVKVRFRKRDHADGSFDYIEDR